MSPRSRHSCVTCGQIRAQHGEDQCPVCWLISELRREHVAGDHGERFNPSCVLCTRAGMDLTRAKNVHTDCDHDATKAARMRCRRERRKLEGIS